jgi:hypothetical protein
MKLADIDLKALKAEVIRIANETPYFVYPEDQRCKYLMQMEVHEGEGIITTGSCLLGKALVNLGVDTEEIFHCEGENIGHILRYTKLSKSMRTDLPPADERLIYWLDTAQTVQDSHEPWGKAVADADATYPEPAE